MSNRQTPRDEFAQIIGEHTPLQGDPNVTGLGPPPTNAPAGIAPPSPLQVQSVFDTRPLAAYDASIPLVAFGQFTPESQFYSFTTALPQGFTFVLRRVVIECVPGFIGNAGYSNGDPNYLEFALLRDSSTIPNNKMRFLNLTRYEWDTHQVFGFWQSIGVSTYIQLISDPASGTVYDFNVLFQGTLIPTKGLPPTEEVGSDPVLVRTFQQSRAR